MAIKKLTIDTTVQMDSGQFKQSSWVFQQNDLLSKVEETGNKLIR